MRSMTTPTATALEDWLWDTPVLPGGERLVPVQRQKRLSAVVDLLFLDRAKRLVLVEIKNETSTRLALGQAFEYLGSYHDYDLDDLCEDSGRDLRAVFHETYGERLDELSSKRRVILAAPHFDIPSAVACTYLQQALQGVEVVMLKAQRRGAGFELYIHQAPAIVRVRKLKGRLAVSPSGRRLFYVLQSGAKPVVWFVGRLQPDAPITLPTNKRRTVFRTNRRVVKVDMVEGVDLDEQGSSWQRKDDPDRLARLLGYLNTAKGDYAVAIRLRPGRPAAVRHMRKQRFLKEWLPVESSPPDWGALLDTLA